MTVRVDEECCGRGGAISHGRWCMATVSDDGDHGQCYYFQSSARGGGGRHEQASETSLEATI